MKEVELALLVRIACFSTMESVLKAGFAPRIYSVMQRIGNVIGRELKLSMQLFLDIKNGIWKDISESLVTQILFIYGK